MILTVIRVPGGVAGGLVSLLGEGIIVVMWTGRCAGVDGSNVLSWNGLGDGQGA